MPLYEYECKKCGQTFEAMQKFSDEPLKKHAGCGGKVDRLISAPGLQFKGTGWYITDYARSGGGGGAAEKAEKSESKSDSKSDSTATATETKSTADKPAKAAKKK
jgi:putative FmdB family regulatory protein